MTTKTEESRETRSPRRERFEFRLSVVNGRINPETGEVSDDVKAQMYVTIRNFNPVCTRSLELSNTVAYCAALIDDDLKMKTQTYLELEAPQVFNSVEEMEAWMKENPNVLHIGEGIVVKGDNSANYFVGRDGSPKLSGFKFDNGELTRTISEKARKKYKFAFLVDGREVCSTVWEGLYPHMVRETIDLTNRRGKFEGEDISRLTRWQYLFYKMTEGKSNLAADIASSLAQTCSWEDDEYTTSFTFGKKTYKNPNNGERFYLAKSEELYNASKAKSTTKD